MKNGIVKTWVGLFVQIAMVIVGFTVTVNADAGLMSSFTFASNPEGKYFKFEITGDQLLKAPIWKAQDEAPPLSPRKADQAASAMFHKLLGNVSGWERQSINLKNMGDNVHWVYEVVYGPVTPKLGVPPTLHVFVLMDGTVIQPEGGIPK